MIYREEILDHYKFPRNQGELHVPDACSKRSHSSCGDEVIYHVHFEKNTSPVSKISEVKWNGSGCAVSMASASMLSEKMIGMTRDDLLQFGEAGIESFFGGEISSGRRMCAMLAYHAALELFEEA